MRAVFFAFLCGAALAAVPAGATPSQPKAAVPDGTPPIQQVANGCGAGWHWHPGWRGPEGYWHHGRCVPN